MITSFSSYLDKFKKKFVGLDLDQTSQTSLRQWCADNGFDLTTSYSGNPQKAEEFKFHITVFFTTSMHDTTTGTFSIKPFQLNLDHFELLGKDKNIPVIKVTPNDELLKKREMFERMGYKDEWPSYLPHISLSYNKLQIPDIKTLKLPDFKVMVDTINTKDQDD